jgi:type II secretory pathway component PulM
VPETAAVILVAATVVLVAAVVLVCVVVLYTVVGPPRFGRAAAARREMREEIADISTRVTAIQRLLEDSVE